MLRMLHSIAHGKGAGLRDAEKREPIHLCSGCDCGHVTGHRIFRYSLNLPVREAVSASIEPHGWQNLASFASIGRQIGLCHSYSRWLSQFGPFSTGAPWPMLAQARIKVVSEALGASKFALATDPNRAYRGISSVANRQARRLRAQDSRMRLGALTGRISLCRNLFCSVPAENCFAIRRERADADHPESPQLDDIR